MFKSCNIIDNMICVKGAATRTNIKLTETSTIHTTEFNFKGFRISTDQQTELLNRIKS